MTVTATCRWKISCETREEFEEQKRAVDEHPKATRSATDATRLEIDADVSLSYEVLGS
jgi:hypothetical protein